MAGIFNDPDLMAQDGDNTIDSADEFVTEIRGLESSIFHLLSIWKGPAAESFSRSADEKLKELSHFADVLSLRGDNITKGAKIMGSTEDYLETLGSNIYRA